MLYLPFIEEKKKKLAYVLKVLISNQQVLAPKASKFVHFFGGVKFKFFEKVVRLLARLLVILNINTLFLVMLVLNFLIYNYCLKLYFMEM